MTYKTYETVDEILTLQLQIFFANRRLLSTSEELNINLLFVEKKARLLAVCPLFLVKLLPTEKNAWDSKSELTTAQESLTLPTGKLHAAYLPPDVLYTDPQVKFFFQSM